MSFRPFKVSITSSSGRFRVSYLYVLKALGNIFPTCKILRLYEGDVAFEIFVVGMRKVQSEFLKGILVFHLPNYLI